MSDEKEGSWAREYRQGRAAQVEQQRIANLIAVSASPLLPIDERKRAIRRAARALGVRDTGSSDPSLCPPLPPGEDETCTHTPTCPTGLSDS